MNINSIKYEYHDVIAETCKTILEGVFDENEFSDEILYDVTERPCLDAYMLKVFINWETKGVRVSVYFDLDTGTGGLQVEEDEQGIFRLKTTKDPKYYNLSISKLILDENDNEIAEFEWNGENRKWTMKSSENEMDSRDLKLAVGIDKEKPISWKKAKKEFL